MALLDFLFGREPKMRQLPAISPEQQELLSDLIGQIRGPLTEGISGLQQILAGEPEAFEAFEKPAMRQFEEQIVPGIAERFTGMGTGAQRSSAFAQALGKAGESLSERLAAQRGAMQQQAMGQLSQLLGLGLRQPTFGYQMQPGTPGFLGALAPALGTGVGMGLSRFLGF